MNQHDATPAHNEALELARAKALEIDTTFRSEDEVEPSEARLEYLIEELTSFARPLVRSRDELREALRPFSELASDADLDHWDESHFGSAQLVIKADDIRRARRLVQPSAPAPAPAEGTK